MVATAKKPSPARDLQVGDRVSTSEGSKVGTVTAQRGKRFEITWENKQVQQVTLRQFQDFGWKKVELPDLEQPALKEGDRVRILEKNQLNRSIWGQEVEVASVIRKNGTVSVRLNDNRLWAIQAAELELIEAAEPDSGGDGDAPDPRTIRGACVKVPSGDRAYVEGVDPEDDKRVRIKYEAVKFYGQDPFDTYPLNMLTLVHPSLEAESEINTRESRIGSQSPSRRRKRSGFAEAYEAEAAAIVAQSAPTTLEEQEISDDETEPEEFTVTLANGWTVRVEYEQWASDSHHFDFHGAISPTGYRSDFATGEGEVDIREYAKRRAQELFEEEVPRDAVGQPIFDGDRCEVLKGKHKGVIEVINGCVFEGKMHFKDHMDLGGFKPSTLRRVEQGETSLEVIGRQDAAPNDSAIVPSTPTEIVPSDPAERLTQLETDIQAGLDLVEQGKARIWQAAALIQQEELWALGHSSFEDYCKRRWGWERSNAYEVASAGRVVNELRQSGIPDSELPTSVSQTRELAKLPAEERPAALKAAIAITNGKPTAKAIREAVSELAPAAPSEYDYLPVEPEAVWFERFGEVIEGQAVARSPRGMVRVVYGEDQEANIPAASLLPNPAIKQQVEEFQQEQRENVVKVAIDQLGALQVARLALEACTEAEKAEIGKFLLDWS